MTPLQEARQIFKEFSYEGNLDYYKTKLCALLHVNKTIKLLEKNRGYTQCSIDLKHYESVKIELEEF